MRQYDSCCIAQYSWLPYLARMHDRSCKATYRYCINTYYFILLIQHDYNKMLPIHICQIGVQKRTCIDSTANLLIVAGNSTFPNQRDTVNWLAFPNITFSKHWCGFSLDTP